MIKLLMAIAVFSCIFALNPINPWYLAFVVYFVLAFIGFRLIESWYNGLNKLDLTIGD